MRIGLDMDGVLAGFAEKAIEQYNHVTGEDIDLSYLRGQHMYKGVKRPEQMRKIIEAPGFIRSLDPLPNAIKAVNDLVVDKHEVIFISNATNCISSAAEKREWLRYYFGNLWKKPPLVLTYFKYLVRCDCLLDDSPRNLDNLHSDTRGLLWSRPYNRTSTGYERIYSWDHFFEWMDNNEK